QGRGRRCAAAHQCPRPAADRSGFAGSGNKVRWFGAWRTGVAGTREATPLQALAAATSAPAEHFQIADRGWIRPGMGADLLLVKGNPRTDVLATRSITGVWKRGVRVPR